MSYRFMIRLVSQPYDQTRALELFESNKDYVHTSQRHLAAISLHAGYFDWFPYQWFWNSNGLLLVDARTHYVDDERHYASLHHRDLEMNDCE